MKFLIELKGFVYLCTISDCVLLSLSAYQEIRQWWSDGMGVFSHYGVGPLVVVRGTMKSQECCVQLWIMKCSQNCGVIVELTLVTSRMTMLVVISEVAVQWYADNNVHRLDWPAQSSHLNPIEHLRDELDGRMRSREMMA